MFAIFFFQNILQKDFISLSHFCLFVSDLGFCFGLFYSLLLCSNTEQSFHGYVDIAFAAMAPKIISSLFRSTLFFPPTLITHAWVFPDELTPWKNSAVTDCLQLSWALKLPSGFVWKIWCPWGDLLSWPSHSKVNNIQLLHTAHPPTSMQHPSTEPLPSFWRNVFLFCYVGGIPSVTTVTTVFSGLICFMRSAVGAKTALWLFIWAIFLL